MEKYWFKPRTGISRGWTPASWEGIIMTVVLVILLILSAVVFDLEHATTKSGFGFFFTLIILLLIFGYIADKKTENPVLFKRK
ncbi:hypothetical protein HQ529_05110 [Candidatus Woesearchaeota archaeon]|nr:hypothetical protein [Candidatus Woesearchaeota archaeon]